MTLSLSNPRAKRRWALLAAGVAGLVLLAASLALALVNDTGTHSVIVPDKSVSSPLVDIGNASVEYIGSLANNESSGTGIFDPFVRLQGSPTERGYNTNGTTQFDTKTGQWTHAILASAIPQVDCDGLGAGTTMCWELFVDINESNTAKYISLLDVEIWFANGPGAATLTSYPFASPPTGTTVTQVYDFSGEIKIHDVNQGSGRGDLRYLVPVQTFAATDWFVLYSKWGSGDVAPDGKTFASEGGFEEWKVRKAPNLGITKTANPVGPVSAGSNIGFDITVTNTGAAAATNFTITDALPAGGGGLDWSLDPAFTGCSIAGSLGSEILTCTFATLAAGGSIGPIHITSDTTQADCALVSNTATLSTGGSSTASVTVECAAIQILKQSTKTGNPLVSQAGAVFSITGPGSYSNSVTDNGIDGEDLDSTIGEVCLAGLAPGAYTVNETTAPTGYGGASQTNVSATAANGTNCGANQPTTANSAVFTNSPLGEIGVTFTDLGSGETASSIVCAAGSTTIDAVAENGQQDAAFSIISNSVDDPTVVTLASALSGVAAGDELKVAISGVTASVPTINGFRTATVIDSTHVSIPVNVTTAGSGGTLTVYDDTDEVFTDLDPGTYTCTIVVDP